MSVYTADRSSALRQTQSPLLRESNRSNQPIDEAQAQDILTEVTNVGSALLKIDSEDRCNRLARVLCSNGAIVTLSQVKKQTEKRFAANRNFLKKSTNPTFWMDGHVAESLAAEYIELLRCLMRSTHLSSVWSNTICSSLLNYLSRLSDLMNELITNPKEPTKEDLIKKHFHRSLAVLCVLGGFQEFVRVGAKATSVAPDDIRRLGTVVEYSPCISKAQMVFDSEESKQLHKIAIKHLLPTSVVPTDSPSLASLAQIVPLLLHLSKFFFQTYNKKKHEDAMWRNSSRLFLCSTKKCDMSQRLSTRSESC